MEARVLVVVSLASVGALVACSGARETGLFGEPSPTTESQPTDPTGAGSSAGAPDDGDDDDDQGGHGEGSSSSSSSSGGSSSGGDHDPPDPWKSQGIRCGIEKGGATLYCSPASQLCCVSPYGRGGTSLECLAEGGGPFDDCDGVPVRCDDRTDCGAGQVCCGTFSKNFGYQEVECKATCTSPGGGTLSVRFCDPDAPTDECAEIGGACTESQSMPGLYICK